MIIADLESCRRYYALHEEMEELFRYIRNRDFSCQAPGRITLLGNKLFINLDEVELKSKEEQYLEFHQRYIDVQIPLLKEEVMGWSPINLLGNPDIAYDSEKDCGFYKRSGHEYFKVRPGQFTIFFPEDAHAPIIGEGRQRKLVAKIKV